MSDDRTLAGARSSALTSANVVNVIAVNCIERLAPANSRMITVSAIGSCGEIHAQAAMPAAVIAPLTISTERSPKRRMMGVVTVFISRFASMYTSSSTPACNGVRP